MINDLFIPRERCSKLQLLTLSCVNNLQFIRLRIFELNYFEFPDISNLNQFPFGLELPFTHLPSVILNSRYFKLFWFPLTVQNNGVQLYDYDYKNNKKFVPGEGIPLQAKEILKFQQRHQQASPTASSNTSQNCLKKLCRNRNLSITRCVYNLKLKINSQVLNPFVHYRLQILLS